MNANSLEVSDFSLLFAKKEVEYLFAKETNWSKMFLTRLSTDSKKCVSWSFFNKNLAIIINITRSWNIIDWRERRYPQIALFIWFLLRDYFAPSLFLVAAWILTLFNQRYQSTFQSQNAIFRNFRILPGRGKHCKGMNFQRNQESTFVLFEKWLFKKSCYSPFYSNSVVKSIDLWFEQVFFFLIA